MNITDQDCLTPEEYDLKKKKEIESFKKSQPVYSYNDLLLIGKEMGLSEREVKYYLERFKKKYKLY